MAGLQNSPPCITARRGGCAINQMSRSLLCWRRRGWFSFRVSIGKLPRPRGQRTLRDIFLIARPPLLAVMQGGEFALLRFIHRFYEQPVLSGIKGFGRS